jgi:protein MpaA
LFIPVLNPDGLLGFSRHNGNRVDLNRNMPTADWKANEPGEKYYSGPAAASEPEIAAAAADTHRLQTCSLSFHCTRGNPCSTSTALLTNTPRRMHAELPYEITEDIGYPTPGSLGTYAGWERKIPTITFEIERGLPLANVYGIVRGALLAVI